MLIRPDWEFPNLNKQWFLQVEISGWKCIGRLERFCEIIYFLRTKPTTSKTNQNKTQHNKKAPSSTHLTWFRHVLTKWHAQGPARSLWQSKERDCCFSLPRTHIWRYRTACSSWEQPQPELGFSEAGLLCPHHQCFHQQKWRMRRKWSWAHVKWSLQEEETETISIPVACLWLFSCPWATGWLLGIAGTRLSSLLFSGEMRQLCKKLGISLFHLVAVRADVSSSSVLWLLAIGEVVATSLLVWHFIIVQLCMGRKKRRWEVISLGDASLGDTSIHHKRDKTLKSLKGLLGFWLSF